MIPYILLIIIPFLFAFIELTYIKKPKYYPIRGTRIHLYNIRIILSVLLMVLFVIIVGTTDGNGLDWWTDDGGYAKIDYSKISVFDWSQFEGGFVLVNQLAGNFHLFIFCMALVCFAITLKVIKIESPYIIVSLFIFIASNALYQFMGVYRHAIAQTIVMLLWITKSNTKKQFLIVLAAMTFHIAAAISFLYFFIPKNKIINIKQITMIIMASVIIRYLLIILMPVIITLALGPVGDKLSFYDNNDGSNGAFGLNYFIFRCFIVLSSYFIINKHNKKHVFYYNTYVVSVAIYIALTISPTFYRLSMFFSSVEIILIPIIIDEVRKKYRYNANYIFMFLIFSFLYVYLFIVTLRQGFESYVPYKSFLFV